MKATRLFLILLAGAVLLLSACTKGKENEPVSYSITVTTNGNGTAVAAIGGTAVAKAVEGATVTLSATAGEGHYFAGWTVVSGDAAISNTSAAEATFVMPAGNVSVKANFIDETAKKYKINVTSGDWGKARTNKVEAAEGETVRLTATPDEGYVFVYWLFEDEGFEYEDLGIENVKANPLTFTMPAADVDVTGYFIDEDAMTYLIGLTTDGKGTAKASIRGETVYESVKGKTVTITAKANDGYVFAGWTPISGGAVLEDATAEETTFTMPAQDISFKANFVTEAERYIITLTIDGNGTADADKDDAAEGETVTISATPGEGYIFDKWSVISGGVDIADTAAAETTFIMSAGPVDIEAYFIVENPTVWDGVSILQPEGYIDGAPGQVLINWASELAWLSAASNGIVTVADRNFEGYTFILINGINLANHPWTPISHDPEWDEENIFKGTFDGEGRNISNLNISFPDKHFSAFFGVCDGRIENLHIISGSVEGENGTAAVCGYLMDNGTIADCSNAASVAGKSSSIGGICGTSAGTIERCVNYGRIVALENSEMFTSNNNSGGICGENSGTIDECRNSGSITTQSERGLAGGICGKNNGGIIQNCYNSGAIAGINNTGGIFGRSEIKSTAKVTGCENSGTVRGGEYTRGIGGVSYGIISDCGNTALGTVDGGDNVGGIVGQNRGSATRCFNHGEISGDTFIGGVTGQNYSGSLTDSYNTGAVNGADSVGGVTGYNTENSSISGCYNDGMVSGTNSYVGGVAGINQGSSIAGCYNTGRINNGINEAGGICGQNMSSGGSITACYNTGTVDGNDKVGGICGSNLFNSSVTACFNVGQVMGNSAFGSICGMQNAYITACYWAENIEAAIGDNGSYTDAHKFSDTAWPSTGGSLGQSAEWGTGDGSGSGTYWKSLGGWNDGDPVYPKLYFE